jgi:hypothetical protein
MLGNVFGNDDCTVVHASAAALAQAHSTVQTLLQTQVMILLCLGKQKAGTKSVLSEQKAGNHCGYYCSK